MKIILAILIPPLAVLLCGRPLAALINFFLCFLGFIPGIIHAIYVVNQSDQDKRMKQMAAIAGAAARGPNR